MGSCPDKHHNFKPHTLMVHVATVCVYSHHHYPTCLAGLVLKQEVGGTFNISRGRVRAVSPVKSLDNPHSITKIIGRH